MVHKPGELWESGISREPALAGIRFDHRTPQTMFLQQIVLLGHMVGVPIFVSLLGTPSWASTHTVLPGVGPS